MAILMFVDGVLRGKNNVPIPEGMAMYRALAETKRVLFLCEDKSQTDNWLKQQRINKFDDLIDRSIPAIGDDPELRQVQYLRGLGPVEMVVTSNPELTQKLLSVGMTTLVFLSPSYVKEEFRPDSRKGVKSWASIVEELTAQQESLAKDPRL